jgi:hypothetical protein
MLFHGIVMTVLGLWYRVMTTVDPTNQDRVLEEMEGGPYKPAFLDHFFASRYRVEVRKIHSKRTSFGGGRRKKSAPPLDGKVGYDTIRYSNDQDQVRLLIKGNNGWLKAFRGIGLIVGNSHKMGKRLGEIVRLTSMWVFRSAEDPLSVGVIDYKGPLGHVDGISAISQELALECIYSNKHASKEWRARMAAKIHSGKITVFSFRALTPEGMIKGNALVLPKWMMGGFDVKTFKPNIKKELKTNGWFWVTLDPSYGSIPIKSDDLTHSIYRNVGGLYDDLTMMGTLKEVLECFFDDLRRGKRSAWMEKLAENADDILHEDAQDRFSKEKGSVGRIQLAVAKLKALGVPLTASQSLMFLSVNGLRKQLLGEASEGNVWRLKDRHWFPVPWAYSAHIMTQEALREFGFHIPEVSHGFYHENTHTFVVPGDFFLKNFENHGGYDLDDTVKIHIRMMDIGSGLEMVAFILRNPNDWGEWSIIRVTDEGPVYHRYGDTPPLVDYQELCNKVTQWSELKSSLIIGQLPCITNPQPIGETFSPEDEERVRKATVAMPGGVGGVVVLKMLQYALKSAPLKELVASNEDVIDALQQGLAGEEDVKLIQKWVDAQYRNLRGELDYFWYNTRLNEDVAAGYEIREGNPSRSTWLDLHVEREKLCRRYLKDMTRWLNDAIEMPESIAQLNFSKSEIEIGKRNVAKLNARYKSGKLSWAENFAGQLAKADKDRGEEHVDRRVLLYAYCSFLLKDSNPRQNHDGWLYQFNWAGKLPINYFIRALKRVQDGEYQSWVNPPMTDEQVSEIRSLYKQVNESLTDAQRKSLVSKMRGHNDRSEPQSLEWGQKVIDRLSALMEI